MRTIQNLPFNHNNCLYLVDFTTSVMRLHYPVLNQIEHPHFQRIRTIPILPTIQSVTEFLLNTEQVHGVSYFTNLFKLCSIHEIPIPLFSGNNFRDHLQTDANSSSSYNRATCTTNRLGRLSDTPYSQVASHEEVASYPRPDGLKKEKNPPCCPTHY